MTPKYFTVAIHNMSIGAAGIRYIELPTNRKSDFEFGFIDYDVSNMKSWPMLKNSRVTYLVKLRISDYLGILSTLGRCLVELCGIDSENSGDDDETYGTADKPPIWRIPVGAIALACGLVMIFECVDFEGAPSREKRRAGRWFVWIGELLFIGGWLLMFSIAFTWTWR